MYPQKNWLFQYLVSAIAFIGAVVGWSSPSNAFVNQIVIDSTNTANYTPVPLGSSTPGPAVSYTIYTGRIFGALNPSAPQNSVITDIFQAPTTNGNVTYIANFSIVTPTNPAARSGLLIYEVPNRGGNAISTSALVAGATYVQSGWQGDLLTQCSGAAGSLPVSAYPCVSLNSAYGTASGSYPFFTAPTGLTAFVIQVPVATTDGNPPNGTNTITGPVYGHILTGSSGNAAQMVIYGSQFVPYQPATLDTTQAQFWSDTSQTTAGVDNGKTTIPSTGWAWGSSCPNGGPVVSNPTFVCLLNGATFNPNLLYEMTFTAANPLVLGVGFASMRDLTSFLRYGTTAPGGGTNPIAGTVTKAMNAGSSQSGSYIRGSIFYGFNQDENGRIVFEGANPQIDGRMMWMNERWAQPNVIPNLYMAGDESPVWWADFPNQARGLPAAGLLDRCNQTNTCPQVLEYFGSNEFYDEKVGPDMTGFCVVCTTDIPLPSNVYRYYMPGTSHGGSISAASFNWKAPGTLSVSNGSTYPSNTNGENYTANALLADFIGLLMSGTPMPPSIAGVTYPSLASGQLVVPTQTAEGFPNIPGFPFGGNMAWPPFVYNFGSEVNYSQQSGIPTIQPPTIQQVLTEYVPTVNADGNENVGSVPSVLFQAPLGTYVGWNIIPSGPYAGQQVELSGAYWPFYDTEANRTAASDPRLSLEERYGSHTGYNCVVRQAANRAVGQRFLLPSDATTLTTLASAGNVLASLTPTTADQGVANTKCEFTNTHGFTGSGRSDILWRDTAGDVGIWSMNGTTASATAVLGNVPNTWTVLGQHDFNGDGYADILWTDKTGDVAIWLMNGTTPTSQVVVATAVPANWTIVGTGDFNGDGMTDILWRDTAGDVGIWLMNGTTVLSTAVIGNVPTNWTVVGTGDFNGDGMADILWRDASGNVGVWLMNGTTATSQVVVANAPTNWTVVGTGDFNSDGKSDILWRDTAGDVGIWIMNGTAITTTAGVGNVPNIWSVAETGDFNGDGMSDILWRDTSGNVGVWLMNGTTVSSTASIGNVPNVWAIQSANAD